MDTYFQLAPCLFFATADDGTLLEVNESLCTVLQYQQADLVGKKTDLFFPVATRIFHQTHLFPLLRLKGKADEIFISLQRADGELIPVLVNAVRTTGREAAVCLYCGIVVHHRQQFEAELITARNAAEKALQENTVLAAAKAELQQHAEALDQQMQTVSKRNEELRQFNRVVTHDMQEPLRKLAVFTSQMLATLPTAEPDPKIQKIARATQQLKDILSGLQQYVWLTDTKPAISLLQLSDLLPEVQLELSLLYPGVALELHTETIPAFAADKQQFRLLMFELLSNALRFRKEPDRAQVRIRAHTLRLNQFKRVEHYKFVDYLRLTVEDSGTGFNPHYKEQAFELFRRLGEKSGRGVGFSLCKLIVENHDGTIAIDPEPGRGTVVTIDLPNQLPGIPTPAAGIPSLYSFKNDPDDVRQNNPAD